MILLAVIGLGLLCLMLGFALGHGQVVSDGISRMELNRSLQAVQERAAVLEAELVDADLSAAVHKNAVDSVRKDLTRVHKKNVQLQEEVTFYKNLMAPGSLARGLQIAEMEVIPVDGESVYGYQLLLTQMAQRRSYISGKVRIDFIGVYADGAAKSGAVLSLTELSEPEVYPLKFRFRYFQDLAGRIILPSGFRPQRIRVTAEQNGREPLQMTFPWPVS